MPAANVVATSRLDRLVALLESGSTPAVKLTAARQLGQVAALRVRGHDGQAASAARTGGHPTSVSASNAVGSGSLAALPSPTGNNEVSGTSTPIGGELAIKKEPLEHSLGAAAPPPEFHPDPAQYRGTEGEWNEAVNLLAKVLPYLRSRSWEARVAAAQAIEAICSASGVWDPEAAPAVEPAEVDMDAKPVPESTSDLLTFSSFSLSHILTTGTKLLSSTGREYELPTGSLAERLARAKADMSKLGLGVGNMDMDIGMDVEAELRQGEESAGGAAAAEDAGDQPSGTNDLPPPRFAPKPTPTALPPPRFSKDAAASPPLPPPRFAGPSASSAHERRTSESDNSEPPSVTEDASSTAPVSPDTSAPSEPPVGEDEQVDLSKLSARERNQLKRKRKMAGTSSGLGMGSSKTRILDSAAAGATPAGLRIKTSVWNGPTGALPSSSRTPVTPMTPATPATPANAGRGNDYMSAKTVPATPKWPAAGAGAPPAHVRSEGTPTPAMASSSNAVPTAQQPSLVASFVDWPFRHVVELLGVDLFNASWEVRHGAALGLREILTIQGLSGGKSLDRSAASNAVAHQAWCDDIAIKLLCVLALDRLGDFVFDHVVAPVRETASQTLASLLPYMHRSSVERVHHVFLQMIAQDDVAQGSAVASSTNLGAHRSNKGYSWEVRHAGFLGLRYEVLARADLLFDLKDETKLAKEPSALLRDIVHVSILALRDEDDDVRAAAAQTLQPLAESIVQDLPDELARLIDQVWDCLGDSKDDLSSSIGGVMDVLSKLVSQSAVIQLLNAGSEGRSLSALIPRLYPFFRHTITSVRVSVLNMLKVFLTVPSISQDWIDDRILRLLFQNLIVEERSAVRSASLEVWTLALHSCASGQRLAGFLAPHLGAFFSIIMTLLGSPIDYSLFLTASSAPGASTHNIDKAALTQDITLVGVDVVIRNRLGAAKALGQALARWPRAEEATAFGHHFSAYMMSSSALQRCLVAVIVQEWADAHDDAARGTLVESSTVAAELLSSLCAMLEAPVPPTYSEMATALHRIQHECQSLYTVLARDAKVPKTAIPNLPTTVDPLGQLEDAFSIATASDVAGVQYPALVARIPAKMQAKVLPGLRERHMKLVASVGFYKSIKDKQDTQVYASVASAVIALRSLPAKLNPVIRSIMNSVKAEENVDLQTRSADAVASFIALCHASPERTNPSDKIVKNLSAFVCQDTTQTPIFSDNRGITDGILSMGDAVSSKTGRQPKEEAVETEDERKGKLLRRGAEATLARIAHRFGERLFDVTPVLWSSMSASLLDTFGPSVSDISTADKMLAAADERGQEVIDCLTALFVVGPSLHVSLHPRVLSLLPALTDASRSRFAVIRTSAAKSFAQLAVSLTSGTLRHIVEHVLPFLGDASNVIHRQGAMEIISLVVKQLDIALLPYIIFFVVPVLGRMSDSDEKVRLNATHTFAALIKMVPLEVGFPDPPGFSDELIQRRDEERKFLTQLLNGTKVEPYKMPVAINAQLRSYQEKGVSWMAFLCRYQLHGILCDDMGLGKTLQSICILAAKHFERSERWTRTKSPDSVHLPSLIICPPTLTHHWRQEIGRYATNLSAMLYTGPTRASTVDQFTSHDVVITSYDTVRMDVEILSSKQWFFCVLDEGHVIKNSKTKTTKAVKAMHAEHRLVLTGTPIQNNVLELWSLFDFLMPGFLGSERTFYERYGKPIVATRDGKVTAKESEAATLALDSLHKQVLPFILRRLKEDALADLPPKIIQDVECDLGELQRQLYEDFGRSRDRDAFEAAFDGNRSAGSNGDSAGGPVETPAQEKHQAFAMMQYLRKLVCHPALIFDPSNPRHQEIALNMTKKGMALHDIAHSPKLLTLKQLLNDCGIGNTVTAAAGNASAEAELAMGVAEGAVSQHRVLVFCQMKQMLDIIENDLFRTHMPSVSYLRLDGNVPADKRHGIVETFNGDPSIDVLLLTTQVGGLGLTLTGADTVIFVEHDWNPMKDLQAMDRAHRLGQKKVVNVYRLITRNTLEAKIMGLQRFKLNVANSVVTQQNSGLETMASDQILDLFDTSSGGNAVGGTTSKAAKGGISQKALLESLQNMPDVEDEEYKGLQDWTPKY